jgi:hypothetical protein
VRLARSCGLAVRHSIRLQLVAGQYADSDALSALRELGMPFSNYIVKAAAHSGRLPILQHLLSDQQCPKLYDLSRYAASSGSINMLQWLKAEGFQFDSFTSHGAAAAGQLLALQHLRSDGCEWDSARILCSAASGGNIDVVEWLRQQQDIEISADVMGWAAAAGQTAMCQLLRSIGCYWDADACSAAAANGHCATLRWLRESGCAWNASEMCIAAAGNGHTDILDYILEQGEVFSAELLELALNHTGMLNELQAAQWFRQHGAEWPAVLGNSVDEEWHDDIVAWARAEGCDSPLP